MSDGGARGPREIVYDEEINPLMAQVIAIAKRAGIPVVANFRLDGELAVTTAVPCGGYGERQQLALNILYPTATIGPLRWPLDHIVGEERRRSGDDRQ